MSLDRVPGPAALFVGGLFVLRRPEALKKANITHVVSALRQPLDQSLFTNFKHHVVDIDDVEDTNIVQHFAASNAFITEGLDGGGGVLVHCAMGKSRSVTLVIAYLLSTLPNNLSITPDSILSLVRQTRSIAEPNPGFMSQLAIYHSMNMPSTTAELDDNPEYQRWLNQRAVEDSNSRGAAPEVGEIHFADLFPHRTSAADLSSSSSPSSSFADSNAESTTARDPASSSSTAQARQDSTAASTTATAIIYRCRRCRQQLATSNHVVEHSLGDAITFPPPTKKNTTKTDPCAHLFLEPLSWMRPELQQGKLAGRFDCPNPKCGMAVGRYAWQGLKCSCGAWVVPGVSLARGKVDEVRGQAEVEVAGGVRRPPPL